MIKKKITELLKNENIELFSFLSLDECQIKRKYLLDRVGITSGSAVIMAVPYVSDDFGIGNISEYAKPRDYHLFFSSLFARIIKVLKSDFPDFAFVGFADHSPIDERHAAALSGLGIIGKNGLLLTEKYSSFIFIGEIITDAHIPSNAGEITYCSGCEKCISHCPSSKSPELGCLSAVTQKKHDLSENEATLMCASGTVWGCDTCQLVCPYTERAVKNSTIYTNIPFFKEKRIPILTYRLVSEMSDEEFSERAYSWRGRETILRNLSIFENSLKGDDVCVKQNKKR